MVIGIIFSILVFFIPLIFTPLTINFFATPKLILVVTAILSSLIITGYKIIKHKRWSHLSSPIISSLALLWGVMGLNIWLSSEGQVEGLINKGIFFLVLPLGSYLIATAPKTLKNIRWILGAIVATGSILAIQTLLQFTVLSQLARIPSWMQGLSFSPAGSSLALIVTVAITLITTIVWAIKENQVQIKTVLLVGSGLQLVTLIAYGFILYQGRLAITLLPLRASWPLALDALKNVKGLLLGVGLGNFTPLFTKFKPIFINQTGYWNTVFQTATNELIQLLATSGILGLGSFLLLLIATIKTSLRLKSTPLHTILKTATYATLASFVLVPASIITYTFLFVLVGMVAAADPTAKKKEIVFSNHADLVTNAVIGVIVVATTLFSWHVLRAEMMMRQAQIAFAKNDAEGVYRAHLGAVRHLPQFANYRIALSQINLTLASSISKNVGDGDSAELTTQQREQISTLVQRAIEQGKIATNLRPSYFLAWQNLGNIYKNLINVVDGASQFAIANLDKAVSLDPSNPILRVEYGGLFYQLSQLTDNEEVQANFLDLSIQQFQTAINLKPNYTNAYYNLANSLNKKGLFRQAYQAMTQVLANLDPNSPDYNKAQQELLALEKKLPQSPPPQQLPASQPASTSTKSELKPPATLASPLPGGPIQLPASTTSPSEGTDSASTTESSSINEKITL